MVLVKKDSFVSVLPILITETIWENNDVFYFKFYNGCLFPTASLFPGHLSLRDGGKTDPENNVVIPSVTRILQGRIDGFALIVLGTAQPSLE